MQAIMSTPCGATREIEGFGVFDASENCKRTCGLCPIVRPPLFPPVCPAGVASSGVGGGGGGGGPGPDGDDVTATEDDDAATLDDNDNDSAGGARSKNTSGSTVSATVGIAVAASVVVVLLVGALIFVQSAHKPRPLEAAAGSTYQNLEAQHSMLRREAEGAEA
jgi:hypothetical protein